MLIIDYVAHIRQYVVWRAGGSCGSWSTVHQTSGRCCKCARALCTAAVRCVFSTQTDPFIMRYTVNTLKV